MTYIAALDPNNTAMLAAEYEVETWDYERPEWREMSRDPEDRTEVDYSDVADPEAGIVVGYGGDHRRYLPGAHE